MRVVQRWVRTCQECGQEVVTNEPPKKNRIAFDRWEMMKCKKCKSEALDYGFPRDYDLDTQKFVERTYEEDEDQ